MDRKCTVCKAVKPLADYPFRKDRNKHSTMCRDCTRKNNKVRRVRSIHKKMGITADEHLDLYIKQNSSCAICGFQPKPHQTKLCIDHDHTTHKVRGLLCGWCNKALGLFRDNPLLLTRAISYLNSSREGVS